LISIAERGVIYKDWGGRIPVALTMPNTAYVGMSSLALHLLYRAFNAEEDVVCERIFWEKGAAQAGKPALSAGKRQSSRRLQRVGLHHFVGDGLFQRGRTAAPGRHPTAGAGSASNQPVGWLALAAADRRWTRA
jgi:hypothetical protein